MKPLNARFAPLVLVLSALLITLLLAACESGSTPTATTGPAATSTAPNGPSPTTPPTESAIVSRLPILWVHGWRGSVDPREISRCPQEFPAIAADAFGDFGTYMSDTHGFPATYTQLLSSPCGTPRIAANVPRLKAHINAVKEEYGVDKVIIVAHSMGGVVARAYIEGDDTGYGNDVAELFTLGSPHMGVNLTNNLLAFLFAPHFLDAGTYLLNQEVSEDFKATTMQAYNSTRTRREGVKYHFIGGDLSVLPPGNRNPKGMLTWFLGGTITNDGLIPTVSSARFDQGANVDYLQTRESHSTDFSDRPIHYFAPNTAARKCIEAALTRGVRCRDGNVTARDEQSKSSPMLASLEAPLLAQATATGQTPEQPTALPSTPEPTCNAEEFARLVGDYDKVVDRDPFIAFGVGEYYDLCKDNGVTAEDLVSQIITNNLPINFRTVPANGKELIVTSRANPNLRAGLTEQGEVISTLQNSQVVAQGGSIYVFYPPTDVETTAKPISEGAFTLSGVTGAVGQTVLVRLPDEQVTGRSVVRIPPGIQADPEVDREGNGNFVRPITPPIKEPLIPRQPRP